MNSSAGDTGATQQHEFNKHVADYKVNYDNPPTSGEMQDILRRTERSASLKSKEL